MQKRFFSLSFIFLFLAIFLLGCTALPGSARGDQNSTTNYSELERRIAAEGQDTNTTRPNYFGELLTQKVFGQLPPFPGDFYQFRLLMKLGKLTNASILGPEYWKQPEFYPEFEDQGVPIMREPPAGRFGAFGYGSFPAEIVILTTAGSSVTTTFYMHTSWLVETYQGMGFAPVFPASGSLLLSSFPDENKTVVQNSTLAAQYFDVKVSPDYILLEPAFPTFSANWTQKIDVTITVKPNTPPGRYLVGIDAVSPPDAKSDEWLLKYKNKYTTAGGTSVGAPWYSAYIEVR